MGNAKPCTGRVTRFEIIRLKRGYQATVYHLSGGRVRQTGAKSEMLDWLRLKLDGHNRSRHGPAWVVLPWANGKRFADFPEW